MAYFEFHDTLPDHFKTKRLQKMLGIGKAQTIGHLGCLFAWTVRFRPGGIVDRDLLESAAEWEGTVGKLASALLTVGFIDGVNQSKSCKIHDWEDFTRGYRKARADAERLKRKDTPDPARTSRLESGDRTGPDRTGPDLTGTDQTGAEEIPPAEASGPAVVLYGYWKAQREAMPIGRDKGVRMILFALARGAAFPDLERAFLDDKVCRGKKIWEVLETYTPDKPGQKSVNDILSKWAGGAHAKK